MKEVGRGRSPAEIHRASFGAGFGVGTRVLSGSGSDDPFPGVLSDPFPPVAAGGAPFRVDGRGAFETARPGFLVVAAFFFATFPEPAFAFFAARDFVRGAFFTDTFFFVAFLPAFVVFLAAAFFETAFRAFERAGFFLAGFFGLAFLPAFVVFLAAAFFETAFRAFERAGFFGAGFFRAGFFGLAFLPAFFVFRAAAFFETALRAFDRAGFFRAGFFRAGFFGLAFLPAFAFFDAVAARRVAPLRVFRVFFLDGARFFADFLLVAGFRFREAEARDFVVARPAVDFREDGVFRADLRVVFADELAFRDFFAVLDRVPPELRVLPFLVAIELPAPVRRPLGSGLGAFEVPEI